MAIRHRQPLRNRLTHDPDAAAIANRRGIGGSVLRVLLPPSAARPPWWGGLRPEPSWTCSCG